MVQTDGRYTFSRYLSRRAQNRGGRCAGSTLCGSHVNGSYNNNNLSSTVAASPFDRTRRSVLAIRSQSKRFFERTVYPRYSNIGRVIFVGYKRDTTVSNNYYFLVRMFCMIRSIRFRSNSKSVCYYLSCDRNLPYQMGTNTANILRFYVG